MHQSAEMCLFDTSLYAMWIKIRKKHKVCLAAPTGTWREHLAHTYVDSTAWEF